MIINDKEAINYMIAVGVVIEHLKKKPELIDNLIDSLNHLKNNCGKNTTGKSIDEE